MMIMNVIQEFLSLPLGALPTVLALPLGIWSLIGTLNIIFTGGVGKNGSTVAVSSYDFKLACY